MIVRDLSQGCLALTGTRQVADWHSEFSLRPKPPFARNG